jgi:ATP-dependent DNA helicase RecQ
LEDQGFIQLTESFYHPSKVWIQIKHEDLYKFQVANKNTELLIKNLLRTYGGELFSNFTIISEKKLAIQLRTSVQEIEKKLSFLDAQGVIIYDKRKDQPQITFTTPRYDASKLPLDIKFLEARRSSDMDKADAMIHYISQGETCRSVFIQHYFGEFNVTPCGNCDYCIEKARPPLTLSDIHNVQNQVLEKVKEHPSTIESVIRHFNSLKEDVIITSIQQLLDSEELYYDENGYLYCT